jgi:hypothetical protein
MASPENPSKAKGGILTNIEGWVRSKKAASYNYNAVLRFTPVNPFLSFQLQVTLFGGFCLRPLVIIFTLSYIIMRFSILAPAFAGLISIAQATLPNLAGKNTHATCDLAKSWANEVLYKGCGRFSYTYDGLIRC